MKKLFIILITLVISNFYSQTNLVCNGSFERYSKETFEKIKTNQYIYLSHFNEMSNGSGVP